MRRSWILGAAAAVGLAALLVWAWRDGGERPLSQLSAPATLPKVGK